MLAAVYRGTGGSEVIAFEERPTPDPGEGQILVRVRATALNRADLLQRQGRYPVPVGWPTDIPGLEYAGVVEATGPGATRHAVGSRVMGLVGGGAHATHVLVQDAEALAVPASLSFEQAAAIPEAFLTAWDALTTRGCVAIGERVLLHAVGSGVGTAAIQLCRLLGATSVGTSRTAAKLAWCVRELGLDEAIDTRDRGFREQLSAPVHMILDSLGAGALAENLASLHPLGRLVIIGSLQGGRAELDLGALLRTRATIVGTVMRTRTLEERLPLLADFAARVLPAFGGAAPRLRPVVAEVLPLADLARAHAVMEEDRNLGKVVLVVP